MSEQTNTIECGYVGPDGVKCVEQIGKHHFSVKAHMKKAHGIDLNATKTETAPAPEPVVPEREEPQALDPRIARLNLRAAKVAAEQVDRVRKNAPDVQFGVAGDGSELLRKTAWARKQGIIRPDEEAHWADGNKLDMAADEGRRIPLHDREPVRYAELVLTARPKEVVKAIVDGEQKRKREEFKRFTVGMKAQGEQAVQKILPPQAVASQ